MGIEVWSRVECFILASLYFPKSALAAEGFDIGVLERRLIDVVVGFSSALASLPPEVLELPVSKGRWSPLEIAEHLRLSNQLFAGVVETVAYGGEALVLPPGVLTAEGTMVAHERSVPLAVPRLKEVTNCLLASADELVLQVRAAEQAGLVDSICFVNPYFGPLAAIECLQLAIVHFDHHHRQLPDN